LIELAIQSAHESNLLTRTLFSSDDDEMMNIAKNAGCEVPFKRPKKLAGDKSSTFSVLKHAIKWLKDNENWQTDVLVILQPTTPFRKGCHIDGVLDLLIKTNADAAITIRKPDYPPHWMIQSDKEKKLTNLIQGGNQFMRRQETPVVYQPAGMVYSFKTDLLYEIDTLFPFKDTRGFFVTREEAINIDTYLDYQLANLLIKDKKLKYEKF